MDGENVGDLAVLEPHKIRGPTVFRAEPTRQNIFEDAFVSHSLMLEAS